MYAYVKMWFILSIYMLPTHRFYVLINILKHEKEGNMNKILVRNYL